MADEAFLQTWSPSPIVGTSTSSGNDLRALRLRTLRDWDINLHNSPFSRERVGISICRVSATGLKKDTTLFFRLALSSSSSKVLHETAKFKCSTVNPSTTPLATLWVERDRPVSTPLPPRPASPFRLTPSTSGEDILGDSLSPQNYATPLRRSDACELRLELRKQGLLSNSKVGTIVVEFDATDGFDRPIDQLHSVQDGRKSGGSVYDVQIRLIRTIASETRALDAPVYNPVLNRYAIETGLGGSTNWPALKAGDVFLFAGTGLWASELKLACGSAFTQVGLVVKLPHPYSCIERLYVLTATRNLSALTDAFSRTARAGVCLFDVEDALFDFHGDCIVYLSRKDRLSIDEEARLINYVWSIHSSADPFATSSLSALHRQALHSVATLCSYNPRKEPILEAYSTLLVQQALQAAVAPTLTGYPTAPTPDDFLSSDEYIAPIVLREQRYSPHTTSGLGASSSSSSLVVLSPRAHAVAAPERRYETYSAARDPYSFRGSLRPNARPVAEGLFFGDAHDDADDDADDEEHSSRNNNKSSNSNQQAAPIDPRLALTQSMPSGERRPSLGIARGDRLSFSLTDVLKPSFLLQDFLSGIGGQAASCSADNDTIAAKFTHLDFFTRVFLWATQRDLANYVAPTAQNCELPRCHPHQPVRCTTLPFGNIRLPMEDEDFPGSHLVQRVFFDLLGSSLVPLNDVSTQWSSRYEGVEAARRLPFYHQLPQRDSSYTDLSSDESMTRLAFAGFVAYRVRRCTATANTPVSAVWVADFSHLGDLAVRHGFERYGATAWFDGQQRPICIHWCHGNCTVLPGDANWQHAKFVWRCSAFLAITITDHLVSTHLLVSNAVSYAARTSLVLSHPLRRLIKPFSFRTAQVNYVATFTLVPERAVIHRTWALTNESLLTALERATQQAITTPFSQLFASLDIDVDDHRHPFMTDALRLYNVIHQFVAEYVCLYYDEGSLHTDKQLTDFFHNVRAAAPILHTPVKLTLSSFVDFLTHFIWTVIGLHEGVGGVVEYLLDPSFLSAKIRPGSELADVDSFLQLLCLIAQTGTKNPSVLDDFSHLFTDEPGRACFLSFQENLRKLSSEIRGINAQREWRCSTWDPSSLECSVSV